MSRIRTGIGLLCFISGEQYQSRALASDSWSSSYLRDKTAVRSGAGTLQVPWTAVRSGAGTLQVPWIPVRSGAGTLQVPWTAVRSGAGTLQVPWTAVRGGAGTLQVPWTAVRSGAEIGYWAFDCAFSRVRHEENLCMHPGGTCPFFF